MRVVTPAWASQAATPALMQPTTCHGGKLLPQCPTATKEPGAKLSPKLSGFTYDSVFRFPQSNTNNAGHLNYLKKRTIAKDW